MLVSLIDIGNSRGIRLPKAVIDQLQVDDAFELEIDNGAIVLKPVQAKARQGWSEAFTAMHQADEDRVIVESPIDSEAFEWVW